MYVVGIVVMGWCVGNVLLNVTVQVQHINNKKHINEFYMSHAMHKYEWNDNGIVKHLHFYSVCLERRDVQLHDVLIQTLYGLLRIFKM